METIAFLVVISIIITIVSYLFSDKKSLGGSIAFCFCLGLLVWLFNEYDKQKSIEAQKDIENKAVLEIAKTSNDPEILTKAKTIEQENLIKSQKEQADAIKKAQEKEKQAQADKAYQEMMQQPRFKFFWSFIVITIMSSVGLLLIIFFRNMLRH